MNKERTDNYSDPLLLKGTGWDLASQMEMIDKQSIESPNTSEWKEKIIQKTKSDLEGLYFEYLIKSDVLPFELTQVGSNIICPKYGNKPLADIVSSTERMGSIKNSIQKIEQLLVNGESGDTHVLISPPGWSGYESPHPTAQIYYYQKQGSEIRSMTFVCKDAELTHTEALYQKLSNSLINKTNTEKERILFLTSNVLTLKHLEPHDIVYSLEQVLGTPLPQMYDCLDNLPEIDLGVQKCIRDLEEFIQTEIKDYSNKSQTEIMYKIGQTVLDMKSVLTRGRKPESKEEYADTFVDFSKDEGCNGGGTIYGKNMESLAEEEEFPNWGICRLQEFCISEKRGSEQSLGLCMICKDCDRAFRSGKTFEQIKEISQKNTELKDDNLEVRGSSVFVSAAIFFISSLFTA